MLLFNHSAYGAVGDFLYSRIGGLEPLEAGYKVFKLEPILGGDLRLAEVKLKTRYWVIYSWWEINENSFKLNVEVPEQTLCYLTLPNKGKQQLKQGNYLFEINKKTLSNCKF